MLPCMARDLINEPPTVMTPEKLAEAAGEILAGTPVQVTVYGREQIRELGLTAFLEVGKGSIQEPKLIVMKYDGDPAHPERRLGLIGKGLTYDSGGYSLQSSEFMETMQHDMSGGAAVICAPLGRPIQVPGAECHWHCGSLRKQAVCYRLCAR